MEKSKDFYFIHSHHVLTSLVAVDVARRVSDVVVAVAVAVIAVGNTYSLSFLFTLFQVHRPFHISIFPHSPEIRQEISTAKLFEVTALTKL